MEKAGEEIHTMNRLYGLMSDIFKLKPWEWLFEDDLFAVVDPEGGETAFVSIMGELGEHRAVGAYMGSLGLYNYWKMLDAEAYAVPEMLLEIPQLQASFEDRQMLEPEDLKMIRQLGLTYRGKMAWPMFRSFRPGFMPWFTDDKENRFLVHILEQALYVSERVKENPEFIKHVSEAGFFARIPENVNGELAWKDGTIAVPPPPSSFDITLMYERDTIEKLKNIPMVDAESEIDLFILPSYVGPKGKRPMATYMLLMVDQSSGFITGQNLLQAEGGLEKMWGSVPREVCNMLVMHDNRPVQLNVQSDLLFQLLQSIADILDFEVVQVARLTALEEAKASLMEFMSVG